MTLSSGYSHFLYDPCSDVYHRLVSLQTSLLDAQNQLQVVLENCNQIIENDPGTLLVSFRYLLLFNEPEYVLQRRESSESEYRLRCLQEQRDLLDDLIRSGKKCLSPPLELPDTVTLVKRVIVLKRADSSLINDECDWLRHEHCMRTICLLSSTQASA